MDHEPESADHEPAYAEHPNDVRQRAVGNTRYLSGYKWPSLPRSHDGTRLGRLQRDSLPQTSGDRNKLFEISKKKDPSSLARSGRVLSSQLGSLLWLACARLGGLLSPIAQETVSTLETDAV